MKNSAGEKVDWIPTKSLTQQPTDEELRRRRMEMAAVQRRFGEVVAMTDTSRKAEELDPPRLPPSQKLAPDDRPPRRAMQILVSPGGAGGTSCLAAESAPWTAEIQWNRTVRSSATIEK